MTPDAKGSSDNSIAVCLDQARNLIQHSKTDEALALLSNSLDRWPSAPDVWALMGGALSLNGDHASAAEALERSVELRPGKAAVHYDLGLVLSRLGDPERAETEYRRALAANAKFPEALNNLGNLLRRRKAATEALGCFRRAIQCRPGYLDAKYNLGLTLQDLDLLDDAEDCYREVLRRNPAHHAASNNYGNVLLALGRIDEALRRYRDAIRLAPGDRSYTANLGMAQLLDGDFAGGWANYGARLAPSIPDTPLWRGQSLRGQSILLVGEQGLGDTIQFVRYARVLSDDGAFVRLVCPAPLVRLMRTVPGIRQVAAFGDPVPRSDWYIPLMSVPGVLGTAADTIPADTPYLRADASDVRAWSFPTPFPANRLRIGLAWRGGPDHWNDRNRSIAPEGLRVFANLPAATFISLQKGHREGFPGLPFLPLSRDLTDFADTAALMSHLDLVVSVDTSVAHLAGALGRPVCLMLPYAPDWRWMLKRDDSPWYPGMRLFRQKRRGQWQPVIEEIAAEIGKLRCGG